MSTPPLPTSSLHYPRVRRIFKASLATYVISIAITIAVFLYLAAARFEGSVLLAAAMLMGAVGTAPAHPALWLGFLFFKKDRLLLAALCGGLALYLSKVHLLVSLGLFGLLFQANIAGVAASALLLLLACWLGRGNAEESEEAAGMLGQIATVALVLALAIFGARELMLAGFKNPSAGGPPVHIIEGEFPYSKGWDLRFDLGYRSERTECRGPELLRKALGRREGHKTVELRPQSIQGDHYRLEIASDVVTGWCKWHPRTLVPMYTASGNSYIAPGNYGFGDFPYPPSAVFSCSPSSCQELSLPVGDDRRRWFRAPAGQPTTLVFLADEPTSGMFQPWTGDKTTLTWINPPRRIFFGQQKPESLRETAKLGIRDDSREIFDFDKNVARPEGLALPGGWHARRSASEPCDERTYVFEHEFGKKISVTPQTYKSCAFAPAVFVDQAVLVTDRYLALYIHEFPDPHWTFVDLEAGEILPLSASYLHTSVWASDEVPKLLLSDAGEILLQASTHSEPQTIQLNGKAFQGTLAGTTRMELRMLNETLFCEREAEAGRYCYPSEAAAYMLGISEDQPVN